MALLPPVDSPSPTSLSLSLKRSPLPLLHSLRAHVLVAMPPSSISQETIPDIASHLSRLSFDSSLDVPFFSTNSSSSASHPSNFPYFNGPPLSLSTQRRTRNPVFSCSLSFSCSRFHSIWNEYNRLLQLHCGPVGFASIGIPSNEANSLEDCGSGVFEDEVLPINGVEAESPKKVLILMSDTGGGHRASAEAIKVAFNQEFGDEYQVFII